MKKKPAPGRCPGAKPSKARQASKPSAEATLQPSTKQKVRIATVLIPIDFSPASLDPIQWAKLIAQRSNASIHLVSVHDLRYPLATALTPPVVESEAEMKDHLHRDLQTVALSQGGTERGFSCSRRSPVCSDLPTGGRDACGSDRSLDPWPDGLGTRSPRQHNRARHPARAVSGAGGAANPGWSKRRTQTAKDRRSSRFLGLFGAGAELRHRVGTMVRSEACASPCRPAPPRSAFDCRLLEFQAPPSGARSCGSMHGGPSPPDGFRQCQVHGDD